MHSLKSDCQTLQRSGSAFGKPPRLCQWPVSPGHSPPGLGLPGAPGLWRMGTSQAAPWHGAGNASASDHQQHCLPSPRPSPARLLVSGREAPAESQLQGTNCFLQHFKPLEDLQSFCFMNYANLDMILQMKLHVQ